MKPPPNLTSIALLTALLVAACSDVNPDRHMSAAKAHLEKGDRKAAVIEIKNALQIKPDLPEARYLLGVSLLKDGDPVSAEVELRKALSGRYREDLVVPELARAMLKLGKARKIVDEFGGTKLADAAAQASLQTTLATAYAALDKPEASQAAVASALAADGKYAPALLMGARLKGAAGDTAGAMAVVDDVLAREPGNADAWKLRGDLLSNTQGKVDDAVAAYRKAVEIDADNLPARLALLDLLMRQGKYDDAARELEFAKKAAPKHPQTRFIEAQLAYQQNNYKLARDVAQQLVQQSPNNARVLQLAGAAEAQTGRFGQAEAYLGTALKLAPGSVSTRRLLIATYLRSGQSAKALATLNDAGGGKSGLPPSMYSLAGQVYLQNGDAKRAEEYFGKALKLDPTNPSKRTALATAHFAGGKGDAALDELQDIAATDTGVNAELALASAHLSRKEYGKALAVADKVEAKLPGQPLAANLRGRIQLVQGDRAAARVSFERALAIDPTFASAAVSLARMDLADNKPDDAKKRFEALLVQDPKSSVALLGLAQLGIARGAKHAEVVSYLDRAIAASPTDVSPRLMLIDAHLRRRDAKQAVDVAQSAVAAIPTSVELLTALGRAQQLAGDANQAMATYARLQKLQPQSPEPYVRMAEAQASNKDLKAAEQSLKRALEIKPDDASAKRGLALIYLATNRFDEALRIAKGFQQQYPKSASGYLLEGDILNRQEQWAGAAAAYRSALDRGGAPSDTANRLHAMLVGARKDAEAEAFASEWLKTHPRDVVFLTYMGGWAIARKDLPTAEVRFRTALEVEPTNARALNGVAWVMGQQGKDGALAYAQKANELAPNQPAYMDTLAVLLAERKDFARAVDLQRRAVEMQPGNARLRMNLAKIYVKSGDKELAKVELRRLAKLGDKSGMQSEVESLLKTL